MKGFKGCAKGAKLPQSAYNRNRGQPLEEDWGRPLPAARRGPYDNDYQGKGPPAKGKSYREDFEAKGKGYRDEFEAKGKGYREEFEAMGKGYRDNFEAKGKGYREEFEAKGRGYRDNFEAKGKGYREDFDQKGKGKFEKEDWGGPPSADLIYMASLLASWYGYPPGYYDDDIGNAPDGDLASDDVAWNEQRYDKGCGKGGGKKGGGKDGNERKVFVGGLPKNATEDMVRDNFGIFGELADVKMMLDESGKSKGYCFIEFVEAESAQEVFANHEHNTVEGKWVDCKPGSGAIGGGGASSAEPTRSKTKMLHF